MRLMASPKSLETVSTLNLPLATAAGLSGMVSVTTTSSRAEAAMRSTAGPDKTGAGAAGRGGARATKNRGGGGGASLDTACAPLLQRLGGITERARGVDH